MSRPRKPVEQSTSTLYRGADGHWHARVTMGRRPDGSTERKHVQRRSKAELRDVVRDLERRRDAGTYVWTRDDVTLGDWGCQMVCVSGRSQQRNDDDCCDRRDRATGLQEGCRRSAC